MGDVGRNGLRISNLVKSWQRAITSVELCPVPVIAAVNGKCIGAGVDLITACDIRVCTGDTVVSVREVQVAITADLGTLQRLRHVTGNDSLVREWCLTGRDVSSKEALNAGLFSRCFDSQDRMREWAFDVSVQIASHSPVAVSMTKHILTHSRDHSVQDGLDYVLAWNASMLQCSDVKHAIASVLSKKTVAFSKL